MAKLMRSIWSTNYTKMTMNIPKKNMKKRSTLKRNMKMNMKNTRMKDMKKRKNMMTICMRERAI